MSARTSILKGHLIRQETESIADLRTLKVIQESCSDADWKSCATAASSYLNSIAFIQSPKRKYIHEWMESDQGHEISSRTKISTKPESWTQRRGSSPYELPSSPVSVSFDSQRFERLNENRSLNAPKLQSLNRPHAGSVNTEILVMCATTTLIAWLPPKDHSYFHPLNSIPETTRANHTTYSRVMKAIIVPPNVSSPCITIYCPPRMRYVHMALRFIGLEPQTTTAEYRCQIRFDDRLLDRATSFGGIRDRMDGYYRELEESADTKDPRVRKLVDAIDMNWLEQRIDCLTLQSHRPLSETLDWYTIFRQSKDDPNCVGIVVMAGDWTCRTLFNTAPVMPPDNLRGEGRVYRLRELEGANDRSKFRWKAEHYCNICIR